MFSTLIKFFSNFDSWFLKIKQKITFFICWIDRQRLLINDFAKQSYIIGVFANYRPWIVQFVALLICFLFAVAGSLINIHRYWQYDLGYYDFGIFNVALRKLASFQLPIIDHLLVAGKPVWADHFYPTIYLLSPIFWFTDKSEALLVVPSIAVAISGYLLFLIGKTLIKNLFLSLVIMIVYFLFIGLQNAVYSDFHELTIMTLPLMATFWAIFNNKKKIYFLFLLLTLGCKESLFLLGVGLAIFIYFYKKDWRLVAIYTFFISIFWGLIAIKIITYHTGGVYFYSPKSPFSIIDLFYPYIKIKTVFFTFLSFLFLPLLAPEFLPIIGINFLSRFLSEGSVRWDLGLHYNAEIAPTLAVAMIVGLHRIKRFLGNRLAGVIGMLALVVSIFFHRFVFHGPLDLALNSAFYRHTKNFYFLDKMINVVPPKATVAAQNNLASRFLDRQVWILRENYSQYKPDYILIDLRPGQRPNDQLGIENVLKLFANLKRDTKYQLIYQQGDQYVFRRK